MTVPFPKQPVLPCRFNGDSYRFLWGRKLIF